MGVCVSTPAEVARANRGGEPEMPAASRTPTAGSHSAGSTPPDCQSNPLSAGRSAAFDVSVVPQGDSATSEHPFFLAAPRTSPEVASPVGTPSRWSVTRVGGGFSSSRSVESSLVESPAPEGFLSPPSASRQHTPRAQPGLIPPPLPTWASPIDTVALYGEDGALPPDISPSFPSEEAPLPASGPGKPSPRPVQLLSATAASGYLSSPSSKHVPSLARSSTESSLKGRSLEGIPPMGNQQQPEMQWVEYDALDEVRCPSVGGRSAPEQPADFWQRYLQQHSAAGWEERCRREAQREEFRVMNDQLIRAQLAGLAARGGAWVAPSPLHAPAGDPGSPRASIFGRSSEMDGAVSRWIDETLSNS